MLQTPRTHGSARDGGLRALFAVCSGATILLLKSKRVRREKWCIDWPDRAGGSYGLPPFPTTHRKQPTARLQLRERRTLDLGLEPSLNVANLVKGFLLCVLSKKSDTFQIGRQTFISFFLRLNSNQWCILAWDGHLLRYMRWSNVHCQQAAVRETADPRCP